MQRKFTAELSRDGQGAILLDGVNIARGLAGFTVTADAHQPTQVTLDIHAVDVTRMVSEDTEVLLPKATRELLIQLGWTPPAEETAEGGETDG